MKLHDIVQTGDWVFTGGNSTISRIIRKFTFSKVNHTAIVFDKETIFETDLKYRGAVFTPLSNLEGKKYLIIRPLFYQPGDDIKVRNLCKVYEGSPYSVGDVIMNGLLFWVKDELRQQILKTTSNKTFMKCDELVARITWQITRHKTIHDWEGLTPGRLLEIALSNPWDYELIEYQL